MIASNFILLHPPGNDEAGPSGSCSGATEHVAQVPASQADTTTQQQQVFQLFTSLNDQLTKAWVTKLFRDYVVAALKAKRDLGVVDLKVKDGDGQCEEAKLDLRGAVKMEDVLRAELVWANGRRCPFSSVVGARTPQVIDTWANKAEMYALITGIPRDVPRSLLPFDSQGRPLEPAAPLRYPEVRGILDQFT
jgi:hypothetical protein